MSNLTDLAFDQQKKETEAALEQVAAKDEEIERLKKSWRGDQKAKDRAEREMLHARYQRQAAIRRYDLLCAGVENYRGAIAHEVVVEQDGSRSVRVIDWKSKARDAESENAALQSRLDAATSAMSVVREVAERITKEGNTTPLDPMWLYERMCEVIEVVDQATKDPDRKEATR